MASPDSDPQPAWTWSAPQRRVLIVFLSVIVLFLLYRYFTNRTFISDPQPIHPPHFDDLADRIDLNSADWQTLAALPLIGEKRAKRIIAYRNEPLMHGKSAHFEQAEDLLYIDGFGAATVEQLRPYLIFPKPSTAPAH